jgi:hypothetical protein
MLKTQKILPVQSSDKLPSIPLVQLKDTFSKKKISQNLQHGRCEYMYAADFEMIERFVCMLDYTAEGYSWLFGEGC